jgi:hypothetical protein
MLFKEIIAVWTKDHTKHINTNYRVTYCKSSGTYNYHSTLRINDKPTHSMHENSCSSANIQILRRLCNPTFITVFVISCIYFKNVFFILFKSDVHFLLMKSYKQFSYVWMTGDVCSIASQATIYYFLFIYSLFNNALISSDIAQNTLNARQCLSVCGGFQKQLDSK